jgi:diguanylate cyclase (GGDEF)-like protein
LDNLIFTSLVSPAIALTLAVPFVLLWFNRRERFYLFMIAAGFFAAALGFVLQCFTLPIGLPATKVLSVCSFMLGSLAMSGSVISRYGRPIPWTRFGVLALSGLASFTWFMFVQPDLTARVLSMNFALGGICLVVAAEMRSLPGKGPVERMLLVLALLSGINFIVRPLALASLEGAYESYDTFYRSLYWTTALFSHAVFSLLIALTLLTAEALDIIRTLRSETLTDPLSGLLNRRGFDSRAILLIDECEASGLPISLVVADLDRFKALNDQHGHAAGDRVIANFGARLRQVAGDHAIAGRLGGEEFSVLLPAVDAAAARLFAEGVRTLLSASAIDGLPPDLRVTGSFGVASRAEGEILEDLTRRADEALYLAKRAGRDNVRMSPQPFRDVSPSSGASQPEVENASFLRNVFTAG